MTYRPFLRDTPTRSQYLSLSAARAAADGDARMLGQLGELLRCIRHPDAVKVLERAVGFRGDAADRVSLATARFYRGGHQQAEAELKDVLGGAYPDLAPLAAQQLGKCLAEVGRYDEATRYLEDALATHGGEAAVVGSAKAALDEVTARGAAMGPRELPHPTALQWLRQWHDRTPGTTARAFMHGVDDRGESSYQRLARHAQGSVLDLACGDGPLIELLAGSGLELTGIDQSEGELEAARGRLHERSGISLVRGEVHALPFENGNFDAVLCHMALMLFARVDDVLSEVARTLRPGGKFAAVIGGPLPTADDNAWRLLVNCLQQFRLDGPVDLINVDALVPETLATILTTAGFEDISTQVLTISYDATPADVWLHFATSYDPQRMTQHDVDALREAFLERAAMLLRPDGRVTMQVGLREVVATRSTGPLLEPVG